MTLDAELARETRRTRSRYDRSARLYDFLYRLAERGLVRRLRSRLWSAVPPGRLLEIGVGTGLNVACYPPGSEVTAIDLSPRMLARAERRSPPAGCRVDFQLGDVQSLEFPDDTFDTAIATFVFCSVPDPRRGLRELRRVVRPGGQVLLLDHVRIDRRVIGSLMDLWDPIAVRLTGAHINRRTEETVRAAGFARVDVLARSRLGLVRLIETVNQGRESP